MPPNLDVYVVSEARDRETIERFLTTYVNRVACEDRGDEQLMILPLNASEYPRDMDVWEWEPSKSLTHVVERGLEYPRRAFSVHLKTLDSTLEGAILAFTSDNRVIFSVSLDDEGAKPENLNRAKTIMHELARTFGARSGFIGVEMLPPLTGKTGEPDMLVYSWSAD
jgi:hypothetical protein